MIFICNTLVTWCEEMTHWKKTLMLGKIEGRRRRGWHKIRWLDDITDLMDMSLSKIQDWWWTGKPGVLQSVGSERVGHDWATELNSTEVRWLRENTKLNKELLYCPVGTFVLSNRSKTNQGQERQALFYHTDQQSWGIQYKEKRNKIIPHP